MSDLISGPGLQRISKALTEFERLPPTSKEFTPKLQQLILAFNTSEGLSPALAEKTTYIGRRFREITSMHTKTEDKLFNLFSSAISFNSMLLQEGLLYNLLYYFMDQRLNFLTHPLFSEANKNYGPVGFGMFFSNPDLPPPYTEIDPEKNFIGALVDKTKELNPELTEHDCKILFAMSSGIHMSEKRALTVTDSSSIPIIATHLTSENKHIQAFAAHLALVYLHTKLIMNQPTLFQISAHLIDIIKRCHQEPPRELNPILTLLLQTLKECKTGGKDLNFEIYSYEFVRKFTLLTKDDWVDEQAPLYGIIQKILDKCKKCMAILYKGHLSGALLRRQKEATEHSLVWTISKIVNDLFAGKKSAIFPFQATRSDIRFPISNEVPLLSTEEEFRHFCIDHTIYSNLDERIRVRNAITHPTIRGYYFPKKQLHTAGKIDSPSLHRAGAGAGASAGAGGDSGAATDTSRTPFSKAVVQGPLDELLMTRASEPTFSLALPEAPITFTIHPRVRAWQKSIDSGLTHYHYDETIPGSLPPDEMILRHRFPPQLFKLAFRHDFSFESLWPEEAPIQQRHFDSLLYIDATLYILEATIDHDGVLYHFYARPIKSTQEFASRGIMAPEETTPIEEAVPTEDLFLEIISGSEVVYTPTDDAIMTFEGHTYKLLKKLS